MIVDSFGDAVSNKLEPIVQLSAVYRQLDDLVETFTATGGSVDTNKNLFRCQTGTSVGGYGVARSKKSIIYFPGESIRARFTAKFTTGIPLSLQFAGLFNLTETIAFGYDGAEYGIIHEYFGDAEMRTITVTGAASGSENATVTIDGDAATASLTSGTVQDNAFEIARDCNADGTLGAKWNFFQNDDKVVCVAKSVGAKSGTYSFSSSTATATIGQQTAGVTKTKDFIPRTSWNGEINNDFVIDPTDLNIYQIQFGYLGAANVTLWVYNPKDGAFVHAHTIEWFNKQQANFGNPSMKLGWTAASLGASGTNLTVEGASAAGFITGEKRPARPLRALSATLSATTTLTELFSIRNRGHFGNIYNQGYIDFNTLTIDNEAGKGVEVQLIRNATLGGTTNWKYVNEAYSIAEEDTDGTTITGGTVIDSWIVGSSSADRVDLSRYSLELLPRDTLTMAVRVLSGAGATVNGTVSWREFF